MQTLCFKQGHAVVQVLFTQKCMCQYTGDNLCRSFILYLYGSGEMNKMGVIVQDNGN